MYLVGAHHPLDPFGVVCFHRFYLFYLLIKVRAVRSRIIVRCVDDSVIIFSAGSGALSQSQSLINLTGITGDIIMKMQLKPKEMIVYFWIGPLPFPSEPPLIKVKFFSASFFCFKELAMFSCKYNLQSFIELVLLFSMINPKKRSKWGRQSEMAERSPELCFTSFIYLMSGCFQAHKPSFQTLNILYMLNSRCCRPGEGLIDTMKFRLW